jgi:hypothetical protein
MPGYCVAGTVGHKILNGVKRLEMENKQHVSKSILYKYFDGIMYIENISLQARYIHYAILFSFFVDLIFFPHKFKNFSFCP